MLAEFKHTLRRLRGQIIGWGIGVGLYGLLMALLYPSIAEMGEDLFETYIDIFPDAMLAMFENLHAITTPMGYMDVYFFSYMHLIIGIMAISSGAGLIAADEERGILDLVLAHPVSRTALFSGRLLGLALALTLILGIGWLSWALPAGSVGLGLSWLELLLPFLPLLALLLLFAAVALLFSMVMPAARIAGMLTGALMVANYLLLTLSRIDDRLEPLVRFTPLNYYQGGAAVDGLDGNSPASLLAAAALATVVSSFLFLRRDIRVGGERGWSLPSLKPGFRRKQSQ